ncbi:type IV pilus modification protein PilV [Variovorax paradoxus]|nr:type IV pilus modification protein PilV [Variovorax paradoxus]
MTSPKQASRRSAQTGVALLEVLVSILIFSFGLLGLIGLQARAISFSVDAEDRNRAALLANEIVSLMWLNQSPTVPAADLDAWKTRVAAPGSGGLPGGEGSVDVSGKTANVTITWQAPAANSGSRLTTHVELP